MLNSMRNSVSGWTAKILLGLLVLSFGVWGIGDFVRTGISTDVVSVGSTSVTQQDYALAYRQAENRLASQIQRRPSREEMEMFGYDQGVLNQLITGALLDEGARELGVGVSDGRLAQLIAADPTFRDGSGNFSRDAFRQILANARISEASYIDEQSQGAKRTQVVQALSDEMTLPSAFETALGHYLGERRTIEFIRLTAASIPPVADPAEDVLTAYFDANRARYAAPEYRSIDYIEISPKALADPSAVTDQDIAADYEASQSRYTTPERRRIQQIVFPDRAAAEAAEAKLAAGTSFEDVAREAGRAPADTDLGLLARNQVPGSALAEAAFTLPPNGTSAIVDGAFGHTILRVSEIQAGSVRPLDEVRQEIREQVALNRAADAASGAYTAFEDQRNSGATFAEAAKAAGLMVKQVPAVDARGIKPDGTAATDLPGREDMLKGVFESEVGFDNPVINLGGSDYVFYEVTKVEPARERTLDEVRDRVVADWKTEETTKQLAARTAEFVASVKAGQTLDAAAASLGASKETETSLTREDAANQLGNAVAETAFSAGRGLVASAAGPQAGTQIVLQVTEVAEPADPLSSVPDAEKSQLQSQFQNDILEGYVAMLRRDHTVSVNGAALEQAKSASW